MAVITRKCYYVCLDQVLETFDILDTPKTSKTQKMKLQDFEGKRVCVFFLLKS